MTREPELTQELCELPVTRYRADGVPTCATNCCTHDYCVFLQVRGMCGKIECCSLTGADLNRSGDGTGFLIPDASCPLWNPKL
jgi:hypothetical protein